MDYLGGCVELVQVHESSFNGQHWDGAGAGVRGCIEICHRFMRDTLKECYRYALRQPLHYFSSARTRFMRR